MKTGESGCALLEALLLLVVLVALPLSALFFGGDRVRAAAEQVIEKLVD